ncbi:MAG TPA: hypothetical protein VM901_00965 [Bdellovibrionota bacterium]|jgi:predicted metallopeptidase|nr:hypothetical protein [Bdellovibrionota bacterium]
MGLNSVKAEGSKALRASTRDLNRDFERLLALICGSIEEFALYDTSKIAVSISRSRRSGRAGTLAYVVPLRYVGGARERKGRRWGMPGVYTYESSQVERDQPAALYIMTFLVPKFFTLKTRDRLETLVHELYHLHPSMRGDLRRFSPPHIHHGPTPAQYDRKVKSLCAELIAALPTIEQHPLLCRGEDEIGAFRGKRFNIPRHVFRAKPLSIFSSLVLGLASLSAHAAQFPVVIIKDGLMRVAPQVSAGPERKIQRGENLEAHKLSEDRQWVWVSAKDGVQGWVHRSHIQSGDLLDRRFGLSNAFVDFKVPNKLGERRMGDDDDVIEDDKPLKPRSEKTAATDNALASGAPVPPAEVDASAPEAPSGAVDSEEAQLAALAAEPDLAPPAPPAVPTVGGGNVNLRGDLEESPSPEQLTDLKLTPEEKSHLDEGEKVTKAQLRAQSRLSPIKKNQFEFRNEGASPAELGVVTWEETFDANRDRANVTTPGKLFESPAELAKRYGILEGGDDVLPLAHTEDGQWMRVRLQETGEEGWLPSQLVKVSQASQQQVEFFHNTLEGHVNYAGRGRNFGFGAAYFYAFGFDERNRSWGLGVDVSMWLGQGLAYQSTATYDSNYLAVQVLGRYNIPSSSSLLGAYAEAGLGYYQGLISVTGSISASELESRGLTSSSSLSFLPVIGGGVKYSLSKNLDVALMLRLQISSNAIFDTGLGIRGNF